MAPAMSSVQTVDTRALVDIIYHRAAFAAVIVADETFFHARSGTETKTKGVQDFVSEADTSVERLVRERMDSVFPGETVLGRGNGWTCG